MKRYWILYGDLTVHEGTFEDLPLGTPTSDVQGIVVEDPDTGHTLIDSPVGTWVWLDDEFGRRWHGCQTNGAVYDYRRRTEFMKYELEGREYPDKVWGNIRKVMRDLPPKSAHRKRELRG